MFTLLSERSQCSSLNPVVTTVGSSPKTNNTNLSVISPVNTTAIPTKTNTPTFVPTPVPARKDVVNIFYLKNKNLDTSLSPIFLNLVNPPLIIYFDVKAMNITYVIPEDYKLMAKEYHDLVTVSYPYENAKFIITVTDTDTKSVVSENGYGGEYGYQSPQTMMVMKREISRFPSPAIS